jgi:hypothetical protein
MGLLTKLKGIFKSDSTSSSRSQQPDVLQRNGSSDDQPSSATSAQDRASYGGTFKDAQVCINSPQTCWALGSVRSSDTLFTSPPTRSLGQRRAPLLTSTLSALASRA